MATLTTLPLLSLASPQAQAQALQTSRRAPTQALCSVSSSITLPASRFASVAQVSGSQRGSSRGLALSRDDDVVSVQSEEHCSGSGRSGEELRSSGLVMRVSGASPLAVAASLMSAGASLADEVAASAVDGSDAGISTTVSVLFVVATVGLVVLTGGVIYLGLTEFLEKRALQEEQKKVEAAKPKKEKPAKQAVKAAARAGGPKGFGSGKRAGAKGDDEEVSN